MKILLLSTAFGLPTFCPSTPGWQWQGYSGIERMVGVLAEELDMMGHDVTVLAGGASAVSGDITLLTYPSGANENDPDTLAAFLSSGVLDGYDVIHDNTHTMIAACRLKEQYAGRIVSTLHNPNPRLGAINTVVLSRAHRNLRGETLPCPVVMNGVPARSYPFYPGHDGYAAFIGTMTPRKGPRLALRAVQQVPDFPMKFAGTWQAGHDDYTGDLKKRIASDPRLDFLGELSGQAKLDFMGRALCLLFLFQWPEPGSFATVEATALGTPMIVSTAGVGPEMVVHGETGFVVENFPDIPRAISACRDIDRQKVRDLYHAKFSSRRMAREYVTVYERTLGGNVW